MLPASTTTVAASTHVWISEDLRRWMGASGALIREDELTREVMLRFLKAQDGHIKEVAVLEIGVQTLVGETFTCLVEAGSTTKELKAAIEAESSAPVHQQDLLLLDQPMRSSPLSDEDQILASCTVSLVLRTDPLFVWDVHSGLIANGIFELSGSDGSIATKIDYDCANNCMQTNPLFSSGQKVATISLRLDKGEASYLAVYCGIVRDGVGSDKNYTHGGSVVGWFMGWYDGSLWGHGKYGADKAGGLKSGQVLTMQVDLEASSLRFWLNGRPHGGGFTSGVTAPLRWAVRVHPKGNSAQIVPTPPLLDC